MALNVPLSVQKLQTEEGVRELNTMLQTLFNLVGGDADTVRIYSGFGSPEGNIAGGIGSLYMRKDGTTDTALYRKETGSNTATGWVASQGVGALGDLSDVDITSVQNGDILVYNSTSGDWENVAGGASPVGIISPYGGASAPTGYLLCDGSAVSRTTYSALFTVVSTSFGVGDGSTTFNLPDLRGRMPLGKDDMGGTSANRVTDAQADSVGGTGGSQDGTGAHTHNNWITAPSGTSGTGLTLGGTWAYHSSSLAMDSGGTTGGNVPPFQTVNYIIKT